MLQVELDHTVMIEQGMPLEDVYRKMKAGFEFWVIRKGAQGDRLEAVRWEDQQTRDLTPVQQAALTFVGMSHYTPREAAVVVQTGDAATSGVYRVHLDGHAERLMGLDGYAQFYLNGYLRVRGAAKTEAVGASLYLYTDAGEWKKYATYDWAGANVAV